MSQTHSQWLMAEGAKMARWAASRQAKNNVLLLRIQEKYATLCQEDREAIFKCAIARANNNKRIADMKVIINV